MSKNDGTQAVSASFNYQDDVNVGLDRDEDIEAAPEEEESDMEVGVDPAEKIQMAVHKVGNDPTLLVLFFTEFGNCSPSQLRKIVRLVRSSPQRRAKWYCEIERMNTHLKAAGRLPAPALMLILDVKTRWSSTHQMLSTFQLL